MQKSKTIDMQFAADALEIIFHHFNAIISLLLLNPDLCFSIASQNVFMLSKLLMFYFILPKISSQVFRYSSIQRKNVVSQHF